MSDLPRYIGIGDCACGQHEAHLYRTAGATLAAPLACAACLRAQGLAVPEAWVPDDDDTWPNLKPAPSSSTKDQD